MKATTIKPIAVLISDVHFNLSTLELASEAMRHAAAKAEILEVSLIVCGDLHDTKANLRGECVEAMLDIFQSIEVHNLPATILVGNHDKINEKSKGHSLEFLRHTALTIGETWMNDTLAFIPYQYDTESLKSALIGIPKDRILIIHQGVIGIDCGEPFQDSTAIPKEWLAGRRVISGHYHRRQDFDLPDGGKFSYVGNPYTLTFGEHDHPEKGFQVLYSDGSLQFIPTDLRKHIVVEIDVLAAEKPSVYMAPGDLLWVKAHGPTDVLAQTTKASVAAMLGISKPFRLDLIPSTPMERALKLGLSPNSQLEAMINCLKETDDRKARLKSLYKELCETTQRLRT